MRYNTYELVGSLHESRFLQTEEEHSEFWKSLKLLKEIPKKDIEEPIELIKSLFSILNNEAEDFNTLLEVYFYILEFEEEEIININDFVKTLFEEFEIIVQDRLIWVEDFIGTILKKKYLKSIEVFLPNSSMKLKEVFIRIANEYVNQNDTDEEWGSCAEEIIKFSKNS